VSLDVTLQKRRLMVMGVVNLLAAIAAIVSVVGYFKFALGWALMVFAAALLVGFAAQIWFIAGLRGSGKGA
jgi:hypothetical protein